MSKNKGNKSNFFIYVKDFFNDMRIELKSEKTIETYRISLNDFRSYLSMQHSKKVDMITFDYVTEDVIRAYVRYAARKNIELVPLEIALHSLKSKKVLPKKHTSESQAKVISRGSYRSQIRSSLTIYIIIAAFTIKTMIRRTICSIPPSMASTRKCPQTIFSVS